MQINQYANEAFNINDEDFYDVDYWTGTAFESRKISGATLKSILSSAATIYNSNGTLDSNRLVDVADKILLFRGDDGTGIQSLLRVQSPNGVSAGYTDSNTGVNNGFDVNDVTKFTWTDGITTFQLSIDGSGLNVNGAYTLPTYDGLADEVLMTDGSGNVVWVGLVDKNIYSIDGTLDGNRKVNTDIYDLTIGVDAGDITTGTGVITNVMDDNAGSWTRTQLQLSSHLTKSKNGSNIGYIEVLSNLIQGGVQSDPANYTFLELSDNTYILSVVSGVITRSLYITTTGIGINGEYTLPNVDGNAGEVITTDGLGNLSWTTNSAAPSGAAGGDLSGTYPNPTVDKIHGVDTQSGTPSADEVWVYGGSPAKWQHQKLHSNQVTNDSSVSGTNVDDALDTLDTNKVNSTRTISTTSPLQGGGDLSANRTLSILQSGAAQNGYLSSADWTTFNNKVSTNIYNGNGTLTGARNVDLNGHNFNIQDLLGTSTINITTDDGSGSYSYMNMVTGSVNITASGSSFSSTLQVTSGGVSIYKSGSAGAYILPITQPTANQIVYASSTTQLAFTSIKTINGNSIIGSGNISVGSVTSVGLTTGTTGTDVNVSGSPVTSSGSITLNIPTASATNRGALSSADWSTFNAKANTASPAFTGTPTAPTAASGTNTTQVATTAFVQDAVNKRSEVIQLAVTDETTAITAGTAKITFRMPYAMTLSSVRASLSTAQTSGLIFTINVKQNGVTLFSTKPTLDNTEKTTTTAATPSVLSTTTLTDDAEITIDVDQIGDGTAKGLKVTLIGTRS